MDLIWGQPVAATDAWVGSVDGAAVDVEGRVVTRLVVKRGLAVPRRYSVPVGHLLRWDAEGLYLDFETTTLFGFRQGGARDEDPDEVQVGPGARDEDSDEVQVGPGTRVEASDGSSLRAKGLRLREDGVVGHLLVGLSRWSGRRFLAPAAMVELGAEGVRLAASTDEVALFPVHRDDGDVQEDVWERLYGSQEVPEVDLGGIRLEVTEGVVSLEGNARGATAISDAERVVRSVAGVAGVENRLVSDWEIDLAAASRIAGVSPGLAGTVSTHTQLGTVQVEGWVPSEETRRAVVAAVSCVAGVVGVEDGLEAPPAGVPGPEDELGDW